MTAPKTKPEAKAKPERFITVQGNEVPVSAVNAAIKRVFDSVQKGKFAGIMREASLIEVIVQGEVKRQLEEQDKKFPRDANGEIIPASDMGEDDRRAEREVEKMADRAQRGGD